MSELAGGAGPRLDLLFLPLAPKRLGLHLHSSSRGSPPAVGLPAVCGWAGTPLGAVQTSGRTCWLCPHGRQCGDHSPGLSLQVTEVPCGRSRGARTACTLPASAGKACPSASGSASQKYLRLLAVEQDLRSFLIGRTWKQSYQIGAKKHCHL